jgi:hypothetical protein
VIPDAEELSIAAMSILEAPLGKRIVAGNATSHICEDRIHLPAAVFSSNARRYSQCSRPSIFQPQSGLLQADSPVMTSLILRLSFVALP